MKRFADWLFPILACVAILLMFASIDMASPEPAPVMLDCEYGHRGDARDSWRKADVWEQAILDVDPIDQKDLYWQVQSQIDIYEQVAGEILSIHEYRCVELQRGEHQYFDERPLDWDDVAKDLMNAPE